MRRNCRSTLASARSYAERSNAEKTRLYAENASARSDVERANTEVSCLRAAVDDANWQLSALAAHIRTSTDYAEHLHPDACEDAKHLYGSANRLADLLEKILQLKETRLPFNVANTVEQMFKSPGFAAYILGHMGNRTAKVHIGKCDRGLPKTDRPRLGDLLVLYRSVFAMIDLEDHERQPFVIGIDACRKCSLATRFCRPN